MGRTTATDPLQEYRWKLSATSVPATMGFQKVGGLNREVDVVTYLESAYSHAHKMPGREKVGEVTLERGLMTDSDLLSLYKKTLTDPNMRTTFTLSFMDSQDVVKKTYTLEQAWVSKWEGPNADATSTNVAIEKLTIQFENFGA